MEVEVWMTKTDMLNQIDSLLECIKGPSDESVHELIKSQLEWKDMEDLKAFYWDIMFEFYMEHEKDFRDDYYWEFLVTD